MRQRKAALNLKNIQYLVEMLASPLGLLQIRVSNKLAAIVSNSWRKNLLNCSFEWTRTVYQPPYWNIAKRLPAHNVSISQPSLIFFLSGSGYLHRGNLFTWRRRQIYFTFRSTKGFPTKSWKGNRKKMVTYLKVWKITSPLVNDHELVPECIVTCVEFQVLRIFFFRWTIVECEISD